MSKRRRRAQRFVSPSPKSRNALRRRGDFSAEPQEGGLFGVDVAFDGDLRRLAGSCVRLAVRRRRGAQGADRRRALAGRRCRRALPGRAVGAGHLLGLALALHAAGGAGGSHVAGDRARNGGGANGRIAQERAQAYTVQARRRRRRARARSGNRGCRALDRGGGRLPPAPVLVAANGSAQFDAALEADRRAAASGRHERALRYRSFPADRRAGGARAGARPGDSCSRQAALGRAKRGQGALGGLRHRLRGLGLGGVEEAGARRDCGARSRRRPQPQGVGAWTLGTRRAGRRLRRHQRSGAALGARADGTAPSSSSSPYGRCGRRARLSRRRAVHRFGGAHRCDRHSLLARLLGQDRQPLDYQPAREGASGRLGWSGGERSRPGRTDRIRRPQGH